MFWLSPLLCKVATLTKYLSQYEGVLLTLFPAIADCPFQWDYMKPCAFAAALLGSSQFHYVSRFPFLLRCYYCSRLPASQPHCADLDATDAPSSTLTTLMWFRQTSRSPPLSCSCHCCKSLLSHTHFVPIVPHPSSALLARAILASKNRPCYERLLFAHPAVSAALGTDADGPYSNRHRVTIYLIAALLYQSTIIILPLPNPFYFTISASFELFNLLRSSSVWYTRTSVSLLSFYSVHLQS